MLGAPGPYDEITMGGKFTMLKVRAPEELASYDEDLGWYRAPPGTLAALAPAAAMRDSGISNDGSTAPRAPAGAMKAWPQAPSNAKERSPAQDVHKRHGD